MKIEERIRQRITRHIRDYIKMDGSGLADRQLAKAEALAWVIDEDLDTIWDEVLEGSKDNE